MTEEAEFGKIYNLEVTTIPTNKPDIRVNYPDVIYKTERAKFNAVVEDIIRMHKIGRPVLVGTISIEKSEYVSYLLKQKGIPHHVLNAKHHEKEAYIIQFLNDIKVPYDSQNIKLYCARTNSIRQRNVEADMIRCISLWIESGKPASGIVLEHIREN